MPQQKESRIKIDAPSEDIYNLVDELRGGIQRAIAAGSPATGEESFVGPSQNVPTKSMQVPEHLPFQAPLPPLRSSPQIQSQNQPQQDNDMYGRLSKLLSNPPLQSQYPPSTGRKILGSIIGGLTGAAHGPYVGMNVASALTEAPYREAYQDWLTKTGALEKGATLDTARRKAEYGGLGDIASYIRATTGADPTAQYNIARAKTSGEESIKQPGRERLEKQKQVAAGTLEEQRQTGRQALADIITDRTTNLEEQRQTGRQTLSDDQIKSREKIALAQIKSREYIAELNRKLRERLAKERTAAIKSQRVPPNQQYLAGLMAEHEVSQLISDPDEFSALFKENKDITGKTTYSLKPDKDVESKWKPKYDERKKQVEDIRKRITGTGYTPEVGTGKPEETDNEYDIEEVAQ